MPATPEADTRRQIALRRLLIAAIILCLFDMFRVGIVRDLHDVIGREGWGRAKFAIGAAITALAHGGYGHTIANNVEQVLINNGLTDNAPALAALGTKFPDNLRNTQLLDNAIKKAVAFKWPFDGVTGVRGSGGDDLGFVDYAKLGFILFGYQIISLYLVFFVIHGVSTAVFAAVFRDRPLILSVLLLVILTEWIVFRSILLDEQHLGTISDPRFLSILAIVPGLQLAFVLTAQLRPTFANVTAAALQAGTIAFVVLVRASALWVPFAVTLLGLVLLFTRDRRVPLRRRGGHIWSLGVLLLCLVLQQAWVKATLNPVYGRKNEISHHVVWHSLFTALLANPNWNAKYAAQFDNARGDELSPTAAKKYLLRHPPADPEQVYLTPDRQYLQIQAGEVYARKAFVELFLSDPMFVAATFAFYNPMRFLRTLARYAATLLRSRTIVAGTVLAVTLLGAMLAAHPTEFRRFPAAYMLLVAAFALSCIPIALTVPGPLVVTDPFAMLICTLLGFAVYLAAVSFQGLRQTVRSRTAGAARNPSKAGVNEPRAGGTHP